MSIGVSGKLNFLKSGDHRRLVENGRCKLRLTACNEANETCGGMFGEIGHSLGPVVYNFCKHQVECDVSAESIEAILAILKVAYNASPPVRPAVLLGIYPLSLKGNGESSYVRGKARIDIDTDTSMLYPGPLSDEPTLPIVAVTGNRYKLTIELD